MKFLWPWEAREGLEKVLLPVLLSICGNTINGLGYIIQKVAHNRRRKASSNVEEGSAAFCKDPVWLFGFMVYATGSLLHATALAYGSESLLQPMESFTLITNAILAPTFLDEEVNRSDMLSIGVIIIGVTFTVLFGPRTSLQPPTKEVFKLFVELPFVFFSCVMILFLYVAYVFVQVVEQARAIYQEQHRTDGVSDPKGSSLEMDEERKNGWKVRTDEDPVQAAPLLPGPLSSIAIVSEKETALLNLFLGLQFKESTLLTFLPLSYSVIAAVFSCYTMILTKAVAGLVKRSLTYDESEFKNLLSLVLIFLLILFNVISECWKQKALSAYASVYVVTVFQVSLVIFSSVGGGLFYHEFDLGWFRGIMFTVGVLIVCLGIFLLSRTPTPTLTAIENEELERDKREDGELRRGSDSSRRRGRRKDVSEYQEEVEYTARRSSPDAETTSYENATQSNGNSDGTGNVAPSNLSKSQPTETSPLLEHPS